MRRYLLVANHTVVSRELRAHIAARVRGDECSFHVVVRATPAPRNGTWTHGRAFADTCDRLDQALKHLADLGANASGEVGDASPLAAMADCLRTTLPPGRSAWLRQDLPSRVARRFGLPVAPVVAIPA
jgi:hypothetical protein